MVGNPVPAALLPSSLEALDGPPINGTVDGGFASLMLIPATGRAVGRTRKSGAPNPRRPRRRRAGPSTSTP
ncbi:hypothetical protein ACFV1L_25120 [Kitasatospora sp. NPDC059646]|uniref:hypothetical protein n=1 Tax=Kitasatospora sp. NPDC059646 TaxID=3346893 RepID=UPI0036B6BE5D